MQVQETQRVIYRCPGKDCKHTWAFDYQVRLVPLKNRPGKFWRSLSRIEAGTGRRLTDRSDALCPKCKSRFAVGAEVKGKVSDHVCDSRCMNAKGPDCECSCGGANHGASWL